MQAHGFWPQTAEGLIGLIITVATATGAVYFTMRGSLFKRIEEERKAREDAIAAERKERRAAEATMKSYHEDLRREVHTTFGTYGGRLDKVGDALQVQLSKLAEAVQSLEVVVAELRTELQLTRPRREN